MEKVILNDQSFETLEINGSKEIEVVVNKNASSSLYLMIKENTNLNNTIRKLTTDLTAAQNHSKELERQLRERNKGCFSGCLGMFIVLIGFTCCIVTFIVRF